MENVNKLKNNINKELILKFNQNVLEQIKFVPINVKDNFLYIAISSVSNKEEITAIVKLENFDVKFMQISEEELDELLRIVSLEFYQTNENEEPIEIITDGQTLNNAEINSEKQEATPIKTIPNIPPPVRSGEQPVKKLGEILIEEGFITETQLIKALAESKRTNSPLGSTLHSLGFITLENLQGALKTQQGYEVVDAKQIQIQEQIIKILPEDFIRANKVIPISSDGRNLVIGMVNPNNKKILKDIVYLTGQQPQPKLLTHYEFQTFIDTLYSVAKKETEEMMQQLEDEILEFKSEETLWEQVERELQQSSGSVAKFVNKIITDAIDNKVSDIHIEPRLIGAYIVRYRKDGILKHIIDIPPKVEQNVITRFKVLSRINIAEHRRPQDGTFSIKYKGGAYDFRINTLPVNGKEKIVIRVLAPAVSVKAEDKNIKLVGAPDREIEKIKTMVSCPNGIILTSGPTGSGKTTTLYSILQSLNDIDVNITTIEDPVEIKLEGINQSQVNAKAGITFASCMRAILRQDPDIILIGEIRDYETLEVAISAALTGHLVLSTVHTNSAAATVTRLIEMGAKDYLVSSTLSGVIAQRLVRRLCDSCKEKYFPTHDEARKVLANEEDIEKFMQTEIYRTVGCKDCEFTGYKGRLGVYEIMQITKEIKKLVAIGAHDIEIEDAAVACGMKTLNQGCLEHILNGLTTIEEFVRVLGIVNE